MVVTSADDVILIPSMSQGLWSKAWWGFVLLKFVFIDGCCVIIRGDIDIYIDFLDYGRLRIATNAKEIKEYLETISNE